MDDGARPRDPFSEIRETLDQCQRLKAQLAHVDEQVIEFRELPPRRCAHPNVGVKG